MYWVSVLTANEERYWHY